METPITSKPFSLRRAAATEESTPPLKPTATLVVFSLNMPSRRFFILFFPFSGGNDQRKFVYY
jgi:hypothetical protein